MKLGLGLGVSYAHLYGGGGSAPVPVPASISPGGSYDGTASSGYGGSPPAQGGVTGTRTVINLPWFQHLGSTDATDNGVHSPAAWPVFRDGMLPDGPIHPDTGILAIYATDVFDGASVTFHVEGTDVTIGPDDQYPLQVDTWWGTETLYCYCVRPSGFTHGNDFDWYATITSPIVGTVPRVIGPLRQMVRTAPDAILYAATAAELKTRMQTAAASASGYCRIVCTADIASNETTYGISSGTSNARRGIVEIDANGYNLVFSRPDRLATSTNFRPSLNGFVAKGVKFDMTNFAGFGPESASVGTTNQYRPMMFMDCDIYGAGNTELFLPGAIRVQNPTTYQTMYMGCRFRDLASTTINISAYSLGVFTENVTGDINHFEGWSSGTVGGPSAALLPRAKDVKSGPLREAPIDAFSWTGPATAKLDIGGAHNAATRTFTFKIGGTTQGTFTASTTVTAGVPSGNYWVSDLVAWVNSTLAGAGFSATLINDTYRVAACGGESVTPGLDPGIVTAAFFPHIDAWQFSAAKHHDNTLVVSGAYTDCNAQQFPSIQSGNHTGCNCFVRNTALTGDLSGFMFQIQGKWRYSAFDHISAPEQGVSVNSNVSYTDFDEVYFRNNIFARLAQGSGGGPFGDPLVAQNNHAYDPAGGITGATGGTTGGDVALEFPGIVAPTFNPAVDFAPAGAALTRTATPSVRYDLRGRKRGAADVLGALTG